MKKYKLGAKKVAGSFFSFIISGGLIVFLILLMVFFTFKSPYFFSFKNFLNIFKSVSVIGITAAGIMLIIISGGIDLSTGAQMAFIGSFIAEFLQTEAIPWYLGMLLSCIIGACIGLINGLLVTKGGFVPFIATLGMMNIVRGTAYIISNAQSVYLSERHFQWMGSGKIGIIPVPVILFISAFLITWAVLKYTVFGRKVYAIGGNPEASRLAGINVTGITISLYIITGVLASISGMVLLGMSGSSVPSAGETYGTDIVTAVLLGGASLRGGKGNIAATFVGVMTIGVMNNGMTLLNVPQFWQIFAKGVLMLMAVALDRMREVKSLKKQEGKVA